MFPNRGLVVMDAFSLNVMYKIPVSSYIQKSWLLDKDWTGLSVNKEWLRWDVLSMYLCKSDSSNRIYASEGLWDAKILHSGF